MAASKSLVSYETLVHAIAGACGSISAMAVTVPLDTARTRLLLDPTRRSQGTWEVVLQLIKEEGVWTLFRGMKSTLQCVAVSNFVYFYAFHGLKQLLGGPGKQTATKDLAFACLAGTLNVLLTNPLWVVNSRIKMQGTTAGGGDKSSHYKGLIDGLIRLSSQEGISACWSGTVPSLVLVSNPAIKFSVYEFLKRMLLEWKLLPGVPQQQQQQLEATQAFALGVLASLAATIITYPVQVLQAKTRHGHGMRNLKKNANMFELAAYILKNFGIGYLYQGLDAKLLQSVAAAGFMFLTYEQLTAGIFFALGASKHHPRILLKDK